jgi:hypothetical protein
MNRPQPPAKPTHPSYLFTNGQRLHWQSQTWNVGTDVYIGDNVSLNRRGHEFRIGMKLRLDDGTEGWLFKHTGAYAHIRTTDQRIIKVAVRPDTMVTALEYKGWSGGLPAVGDFVSAFTDASRIGIVVKPGVNSTYVVWLDDPDRNKEKFGAAKLAIREVQVTPV